MVGANRFQCVISQYQSLSSAFDDRDTAIHRYRYIFSTVSCNAANCALTYFLQTRYIVVVAAHEKTYLARDYHGSFFD
jgi:hypothetical protein